jgi:RNA polymerase sigma-70 factor (ECF subfamily)
VSGENIALFEQDVHAILMDKDYERILNEAVDRLPPQQKQVYILSKQEDLKRDDVAVRMNLSPDTVKAHLAQAMRTVRAYCMARIEFCLLILFSAGILIFLK